MIFGVVAVVVAAGLWWLGVGSGSGLNLPAAADLPNTEEAIYAAKEVQGLASEQTERITAELTGGGQRSSGRVVEGLGEVVPMVIGGVSVWASVATTTIDRVKGLSGTPALPEEVVKLFVFDTPGQQPIWMKDMLYAIDIVWLDGDGLVVHLAEQVSPETYPETFSSPRPAKYVIETAAGFVSKHSVGIGTKTVLPEVIADM